MDIWDQIIAQSDSGIHSILVTITASRGSVPGEVGSKAIITSRGLEFGNLGGGKVEAQAIATAQSLLESDESFLNVTWNLQRDVGMTCGGEMSFFFEKIAAQPPWHIVVFGAGHVSQALIPVLSPLACRIDVFDTRAEWLDRFSPATNLRCHLLKDLSEGLSHVTECSFVLSITQGHSTDVVVLTEIMRHFESLPFLGVIGSDSKRLTLLRHLREAGASEKSLSKLVCPLGLSLGSNSPAEIAISIAAQLLLCRDGKSLASKTTGISE